MPIALVTCSALPGLTADDALLLARLRAHGIQADPVVWEDPYVDWSEWNACVVRSVWDYAYRISAFLRWVRTSSDQTRLINPAPLIRWNTHKAYLLDLEDRLVPIVPTEVLRAGTTPDLSRTAEERGWSDVVLKPAVGASGRLAMVCRARDRAVGQAHLDRIVPHEDMLVQPLIEGVVRAGELSLMFVDGRYTHAVRKVGADGDFRVHHDFGGSVMPDDPSPAEFTTAEAAISALDGDTTYARVDIVAGADGQPMVMELEVVEPELFLRYSDAAAEQLTRAVIDRSST